MGIPLRALVQLFVFIIVTISLGLGLIKVAKAADPTEKKNLQFYVNQALTQAFDELHMDAAKKQLFETEVLPEGLVFVTGYNATYEGTDVQVDQQKLKNYLRFHSGLFSSSMSAQTAGAQPTAPVICLSVRAEAG